MTLKAKRLKDIMDKLQSAIRQGECDLEELKMSGVCVRCSGLGSINEITEHYICPDCQGKGIV